MTEVALLFPGQGSQHVRMAAGLYGQDEAFTDAVDEVFAALGPDGPAIRADWLTDSPVVPLDHVTRSQILLFTVGHALGRMILSWGVRPVALLGHSVGEVAAATLAGVFEVQAAADLMWRRVQELAAAPAGGMLAVAATVEDVTPVLTDEVVIGAINAPRQLILSGPEQPLAEASAKLRAAGRTCLRVPATSAFHSPALADAAARCLPSVAAAQPSPPKIPMVSGYTGRCLTDTEATDPAYWASHPVEPVRFWPALGTLLGPDSPLAAGGERVLLETGPSQLLAKAARMHPAVRAGEARVVGMLPARAGGPEADLAAMAACREALGAAG
ncbi:acyltransferase domain-containing protein [Amycolatopsis silviterrae]|uniref:Acyltransferase domain-containing protein n=1 Tax=Amycolatopsis silviterrae TaxID=1656914 RepID=A0ABW5HDR4_9PSEU